MSNNKEYVGFKNYNLELENFHNLDRIQKFCIGREPVLMCDFTPHDYVPSV